MTAEQRLADLLRERGAESVDHPGGALYAHLERVQRRPAGCSGRTDPPTVCAGAQFAVVELRTSAHRRAQQTGSRVFR
ncbi:hypothetical protein SAMN05428965_3083 [Geodermatophilus sp. DSM 45219]|nr:hypothetical protein SAMN05428965_3083 [Geodermatophilus sp. DSM 45219]